MFQFRYFFFRMDALEVFDSSIYLLTQNYSLPVSQEPKVERLSASFIGQTGGLSAPDCQRHQFDAYGRPALKANWIESSVVPTNESSLILPVTTYSRPVPSGVLGTRQFLPMDPITARSNQAPSNFPRNVGSQPNIPLIGGSRAILPKTAFSGPVTTAPQSQGSEYLKPAEPRIDATALPPSQQLILSNWKTKSDLQQAQAPVQLLSNRPVTLGSRQLLPRVPAPQSFRQSFLGTIGPSPSLPKIPFAPGIASKNFIGCTDPWTVLPKDNINSSSRPVLANSIITLDPRSFNQNTPVISEHMPRAQNVPRTQSDMSLKAGTSKSLVSRSTNGDVKKASVTKMGNQVLISNFWPQKKSALSPKLAVSATPSSISQSNTKDAKKRNNKHKDNVGRARTRKGAAATPNSKISNGRGQSKAQLEDYGFKRPWTPPPLKSNLARPSRTRELQKKLSATQRFPPKNTSSKVSKLGE